MVQLKPFFPNNTKCSKLCTFSKMRKYRNLRTFAEIFWAKKRLRGNLNTFGTLQVWSGCFTRIGGGDVKERVKRLVFKGIGGGRVIEKVGIEGRGEEVREQELGEKVEGEEVVREFVEEFKIEKVVKVKVKKVVKALVEEVEVGEVAEELVKDVKVE